MNRCKEGCPYKIHHTMIDSILRNLHKHYKRNKVSNMEFAKTDTIFINACELAGTKPTARQASKYRNREGSAYPMRSK